MKKLISILLCLVLTASVAMPAWAESGEKDYPVILIPGRGVHDLMYDEQGNQILPFRYQKPTILLKPFWSRHRSGITE